MFLIREINQETGSPYAYTENWGKPLGETRHQLLFPSLADKLLPKISTGPEGALLSILSPEFQNDRLLERALFLNAD